MGVSSSKTAKMQVVMMRGSRTVYEPEISFWRVASRSALELSKSKDFEFDHERILAWKASIDAVAHCNSVNCTRQGGVLTRKRYIVTRAEYDRAHGSIRAFMLFLKSNYDKVHRMHPKTLEWFFTIEPAVLGAASPAAAAAAP